MTVEHLADPKGNPSSHDAPLQFEVGNHDDIQAVVERLRQRGDLGDDTAMALGVGLKLFGEVMLDNRQHPLFADFLPHFGEFIRHLKQGGKSRQEG